MEWNSQTILVVQLPPMPKPFPLQLALQGGGAKIIHLVAALEAIEDLQRQNRIQITRIAGTSAGAIAGSLFAAGIDMAAVKAELRNFRQYLDSFPEPSRFDFFKTIVWKGASLASTEKLREFLTRLFDGKRKSLVRDIPTRAHAAKGPEMIIVSADLYTGTSHIAKDDESIVTALLDSCAIPFYFRVWKHPRGGIVDGGICENLPAALLRKEQEKYGPILAVSFNRPATLDPKTWLDYAQALLDTAIHNSVARATQELSPEQVLPIQTDLGTFDFSRALSDEGLGTMYDATRLLTEKFFEDFLKSTTKKSVAPLRGDPWVSQNPETMRNIGSLYAETFGNVKYKVKKASYVVQANCLLKDGEPFFDTPDVATFRLVINSTKEPVHAQKFSMTVSPDSSFGGQAELHVSGPAHLGHDFKPVLFPATRPEHLSVVQGLEKNVTVQNIREVVAFFSPFLPPNEGPFSLVFKELLKGSMAPLRDEGVDSLWITRLPRADGPIDQMDLVLLVPESFGTVSMLRHEESKNDGARLNGADLEEYLQMAPAGFRPYAWTARNVDASGSFAVKVLRG
jgi:predicted acylesterase/phospholipase RssA